MTPTAEFRVYGRPQQRGSKRAMPLKNGKTIMVDANKNSRAWMDAVAAEAAAAWDGRDLLQGPVAISVTFEFKRPKAHLRKNGDVKPAAPELFTSSPDLDKLLRALGDALTGVVYADDRQVALYHDCEKRYTLSSEGAIVRVFDLSQTP